MAKAKRMTPRMLEWRIRRGLAKHRLRLAHGSYFPSRGNPICCAIGGAIAYAARDRRELNAIGDAWRQVREEGGALSAADVVAAWLDHRVSTTDMLNLEYGFENYRGGRGPFYRLGKNLREEVRA